MQHYPRVLGIAVYPITANHNRRRRLLAEELVVRLERSPIFCTVTPVSVDRAEPGVSDDIMSAFARRKCRLRAAGLCFFRALRPAETSSAGLSAFSLGSLMPVMHYGRCLRQRIYKDHTLTGCSLSTHSNATRLLFIQFSSFIFYPPLLFHRNHEVLRRHPCPRRRRCRD